MKKAKITFRTVTPMILGGANQKTAELRAPSIRGALRFWFRILGGSFVEEKKIFGGIGKNDEGRASSLMVRVQTPASEIKKLECKQMENVSTAGRFDYFLWPLRNPQDARGIITEDQKIEISISHRRVRDSHNLDEKVIKAFLLLGSLGTRSRRAYGSIYPTDDVTIDGEKWNIPVTEEELKIELAEILKGVNCKILKLKSADTAKEAIQTCANALKRFRCGKDGHGMKASEWGKSDHDIPFKNHDTIYRAAIGLPLAQNYSRDKINNFQVFKDQSDRWASPVIFKILLLENMYVPIVLFMKDYFMPDCNVKKAKNSRELKKGICSPLSLSHDLLNEMMDEKTKFWNGAEKLI